MIKQKNEEDKQNIKIIMDKHNLDEETTKKIYLAFNKNIIAVLKYISTEIDNIKIICNQTGIEIEKARDIYYKCNNNVNINYNEEKIEKKLQRTIEDFEIKYEEKLSEYIYIDYNDLLSKVQIGGYIRYINLDGELRWGGILIKIEDIESRDTKLLLMNTSRKFWEIKFSKNYITTTICRRKMYRWL